MKRLERRFRAGEDDATGEMGWQPVDCDREIYSYLAYPPGLAHDVLEHFSFRGVECENCYQTAEENDTLCKACREDENDS